APQELQRPAVRALAPKGRLVRWRDAQLHPRELGVEAEGEPAVGVCETEASRQLRPRVHLYHALAARPDDPQPPGEVVDRRVLAPEVDEAVEAVLARGRADDEGGDPGRGPSTEWDFTAKPFDQGEGFARIVDEGAVAPGVRG